MQNITFTPPNPEQRRTLLEEYGFNVKLKMTANKYKRDHQPFPFQPLEDGTAGALPSALSLWPQ